MDTVPANPAVPVEPEVTRSERRPRDLALSLLVLLVPIALLMGVYRVMHQGDRPLVVDTAPVLAQARAAGHFPVATPRGLPEDWQPIAARYTGGDGSAVLRIGYVSPDGGGVQLLQSDRPADTLLRDELTDRARPLGAASVDGRSWQRYQARPGERALVLLEPERTMLVTGVASDAELAELARSLAG